MAPHDVITDRWPTPPPVLLSDILYHFMSIRNTLHHSARSIATTRLRRLAATMSTTKKSSSIEVYTDQTPNGVKISMALEELGLSYKLHAIDISKNTQKEPWFLDINPNGRIPAITDTLSTSDGKEERIRVFESASILLYLIDQYDPEHKLSYPRGTKEYYEMVNWVMFQNAQLGPMQGQANHFNRYVTGQEACSSYLLF